VHQFDAEGTFWPPGPRPPLLDADGEIYVATKDGTAVYVLAALD
jgi:hypothetical protein